jgi:uncharacterized small protein (DUF1192 family)
MARSRPLRRLLRVLEIEEEQRQLELEAAVGELRRLEGALAAAAERDRGGRLLVSLSARSGEATDRLAGLEESLAAARSAGFLAPRIAFGQQEVSRLREELLAKRVGRRQAEHVLRGLEARQARQTVRRGQQALDEGHLSQMRRDEAKKGRETPRDGTKPGEARCAEGEYSRRNLSGRSPQVPQWERQSQS